MKIQLTRPILLCSLAAGILAVAGLIAFPTAARLADAEPALPAAPAADSGKEAEVPAGKSWEDVERLVSEQKFEAASTVVARLRQAAADKGAVDEWTRGLIQETQLRVSLHGPETAVRFLREQVWPEDEKAQTLLYLFYGRSLWTYLQNYAWEIDQREAVVSGEELDLKAWTRDQIAAEAHRAYGEVWRRRGAWGAESLGSFAEYIDQNTYPPRIRGTLRDAVTYLWVEMLADTSGWRPEHSSRLYLLDLQELLADGKLTDAELGDADLHPLRKEVGLLADLEAWHRQADRPEAAFEARLERLRRLRAAFSEAGQRKLLAQDLEKRLEGLGSRFPWWSAGMALASELARESEGPDAWVKARDLARRGAQAHPDSFGGQQCRTLAESLEAPSFNLTAMSTDGARRRSVQVEHRNLPRLHFRAYAVDLEELLAKAQDYNLLPGRQQLEALLARAKPVTSWTVELPPTPDLRSHRTYVTPPLDGPGLFVLVASARQDFAPGGNRLAAVNLLLSGLVLETREIGEGVEVTVRDGAQGKALAGVSVDLFRFDWQQGHRAVRQARTDAQGRATFELKQARNPHFLVARQGKDLALDPRYLHGVYLQSQEKEKRALLYTDRSVYRPRQTVRWKAVVYEGQEGSARFQVAPGQKVTVDLMDTNGQLAARQEGTTNEFGSASGELEIPAGKLLGSWFLQSSFGGGSQILVEEYKRPTFEVELLEPEEALRLNRPARLRGQARYYFGLPVAEGVVGWKVTREPVYPRFWWWGRMPGGEEEIVAGGSSEVTADGSFEVRFLPAADEEKASGKEGLTYRYRLDAELTDAGGETRSASRSFRLGAVAVEAVVTAEGGFQEAEKPIKLEVRRLDLDGIPRPGEGTWHLLRLRQPETALLPSEQPLPPAEEGFYSTEGDRSRPRWQGDVSLQERLASWADGEEVAAGTTVHGDKGSAAILSPPLAGGAYRLRYATVDSFGATFSTTYDFTVLDPRRGPLALPLVLAAKAASAAVGEVLRVAVHSGLDDQELLLEMMRGSEPLRQWQLRSQAGSELLEIPITADLRGGFGLRLSALRDYQWMSQETSISVPWDDRRLELRLATFRDRLRPGQKEAWRLEIVGADEQAVEAGAAEILASMYDRSLDFFAPHEPLNPLSLYPSAFWLPPVQVSLGSGGEIWQRIQGFASVSRGPSLQGDRLKFYDSYGIGGLGQGRGMRGQAMPLMMAAAAPAEMEGGALLRQKADSDAAGLVEEIRVAAEGSDSPPPAKTTGADEPIRENFAETAFWYPHLRTGPGGSVAIEFEVPDSVTEWNFWALGLTKDLRSGLAQARTRTVKELLVRPYLPRFLREGDEAELRVVVQNAGEEELSGTLDLAIEDPETGDSLSAAFGLSKELSLARPFTVAAGRSATLSFPVRVPPRVGTITFRVVGRAGSWSDGELRPLPVLPGRMHLAQSRFTALREGEERQLHFADLAANDDPSRIQERLVVTLDGQLFYGVLEALPYLVEYPYECTEQTLNRFLSTGIVSQVFDRYPAVARMAKELSKRETQLPSWDDADANRRMALEETPWLREARGGATEGLIKVLDPRIAAAQQKASLAKLEEAQTSLGGFPWWPGGPPSPFMTLYLLQGFSRALEFGVEVPQELVLQAWQYLHRHYVDEMARQLTKEDCCWEMVTFLNFVLSSYPDESWTGGVFSADDRQRMLDFSFRHWRQHSPRLKAALALTLKRSGRSKDATLVFDSVLDSAKTTAEEGTFWQPEDRAWLWYNDTIEGHALALRTLMELAPQDGRRHGLVQWLFLNKKLNHWQSTRATAEVVYALVHYLDQEGALAVQEEASVTVGPRNETFLFRPDAYTGKKNQVVIDGPEVEPATMSTVQVAKEGKGLLFASATWHFSTERMPAEASGDFLGLQRRVFKRAPTPTGWQLEPLAEGAQLAVGDQVEVQLSLRSRQSLEYVHLRLPRPAGFEPESTTSGYRWDLGLGRYEEVRDSGTNFFFEWLPAGEYTLKVRLRATTAGRFKFAPAVVRPMYAPEFVAYSQGEEIRIVEGAVANAE